MKQRLILADDHKIFLDGLVSLLESNYNIIATAANGRDLIAQVRKHHPELVIADISMPQLNGLEAVRKLKRMDKRLKIIVLTMHQETTFVVQALRAGADGYILKNSGAEELVSAIRDVLSGRTYLSPFVTGDAVSELMKEDRSSAQPALTTRQKEVLQLISEGHTLKQVAEMLHISLSTVEFHKMAAMRRLGIESTAQLVRYAIAHGISPM